jgi:hypothetical protein
VRNRQGGTNDSSSNGLFAAGQTLGAVNINTLRLASGQQVLPFLLLPALFHIAPFNGNWRRYGPMWTPGVMSWPPLYIGHACRRTTIRLQGTYSPRSLPRGTPSKRCRSRQLGKPVGRKAATGNYSRTLTFRVFHARAAALSRPWLGCRPACGPFPCRIRASKKPHVWQRSTSAGWAVGSGFIWSHKIPPGRGRLWFHF